MLISCKNKWSLFIYNFNYIICFILINYIYSGSVKVLNDHDSIILNFDKTSKFKKSRTSRKRAKALLQWLEEFINWSASFTESLFPTTASNNDNSMWMCVNNYVHENSLAWLFWSIFYPLNGMPCRPALLSPLLRKYHAIRL